jgi:hypothetical protein
MFRSDCRGLKYYKAEDSGLAFDLARLVDFSVQFEDGGGGAPMATPTPERHNTP